MASRQLSRIRAVEQRIVLLCGHKVMLSTDLAELYGVTTKHPNQQVKRNRDRFPADFMFQLTPKEKEEVVTYCDHLYRLRFSPTSQAFSIVPGPWKPVFRLCGAGGALGLPTKG